MYSQPACIQKFAKDPHFVFYSSYNFIQFSRCYSSSALRSLGIQAQGYDPQSAYRIFYQTTTTRDTVIQLACMQNVLKIHPVLYSSYHFIPRFLDCMRVTRYTGVLWLCTCMDGPCTPVITVIIMVAQQLTGFCYLWYGYHCTILQATAG